MKNEINNISKKKSFLGEFLKEYALHLIVAFGFLYLTVAGIIGNLVSKEDNIIDRIFDGMVTGIFAALDIFMVLGMVLSVLWMPLLKLMKDCKKFLFPKRKKQIIASRF